MTVFMVLFHDDIVILVEQFLKQRCPYFLFCLQTGEIVLDIGEVYPAISPDTLYVGVDCRQGSGDQLTICSQRDIIRVGASVGRSSMTMNATTKEVSVTIPCSISKLYIYTEGIVTFRLQSMTAKTVAQFDA